MRSMTFRCPAWMFALILFGAFGPLAILPIVSSFGWPPVVSWILGVVAAFMIVYAFTLLPTKIEVSDAGLFQKQMLSELRLSWSDIAEWQYFRVQDVEGFWVRDRRGKKHDLKRWLVFGRRRSQELAQVMRERGVDGREVYDA